MGGLGDVIRFIARIFGTPIRDARTGEKLGKAFFLCWRGKLRVIGYTGTKPLRPVVIPSSRVDYWKLEMGFRSPQEPDYPDLAGGDRE